jgi:hypothetical protein
MKNNNPDVFWLDIPVILIKIVRILIKKPSGQPKTIELIRWGKSIKIATDPELGLVRLEVITSPVLCFKDKKSKPNEGHQRRLDSDKDK